MEASRPSEELLQHITLLLPGGSTKARILNWNSLTRGNRMAPSRLRPPFCIAVSEQWRRSVHATCTRLAAPRKQDVTFSLCGVEEVFLLECIKPPQDSGIHFGEQAPLLPLLPHPTCSAWTRDNPPPLPFVLSGAKSNKAGFTYHQTNRL